MIDRDVLPQVTRRLIPFLFICYVIAYIDRVNIGFAASAMQRDLGLSDSVYGTGAGLFFLGYFLFEIPSNLILERVGARRWMARIMIVWGLVSMATMFVEGKWSFYMRVPDAWGATTSPTCATFTVTTPEKGARTRVLRSADWATATCACATPYWVRALS